MTLDDIQPGDIVLYHHYLAGTVTVAVDRTSRTQIMIGDKHFRRKEGFLVGSGTGRRHRASDWIEVEDR